ncbi:MAG: hypothetical protein ACFFC7_00150 [Candidatus Hermodarchaeota archaeon]
MTRYIYLMLYAERLAFVRAVGNLLNLMNNSSRIVQGGVGLNSRYPIWYCRRCVLPVFNANGRFPRWTSYMGVHYSAQLFSAGDLSTC